MRSFHVPSRSELPSTAAKLAANAPNNIAAVSQKDSFAAVRRVLSAAVFASTITSFFRDTAHGFPGTVHRRTHATRYGRESSVC